MYESDIFLITKRGIFVGKGYADGGMLKFHIMDNKCNINDNNPSTYLFDSSNVWYARLGHVNFDTLRWLIKF